MMRNSSQRTSGATARPSGATSWAVGRLSWRTSSNARVSLRCSNGKQRSRSRRRTAAELHGCNCRNVWRGGGGDGRGGARCVPHSLILFLRSGRSVSKDRNYAHQKVAHLCLPRLGVALCYACTMAQVRFAEGAALTEPRLFQTPTVGDRVDGPPATAKHVPGRSQVRQQQRKAAPSVRSAQSNPLSAVQWLQRAPSIAKRPNALH